MQQHKSESPEWLALVREKVQTLRYGIVQIVVHDSKVTQNRADRENADRKLLCERARKLTFRRPDILEGDQTQRNIAHRTSGGSFKKKNV